MSSLWYFHSADKLSPVKQRNNFTDHWSRVNDCTTGVGVGTWTTYPVHICSTLPPPQMRQLFYCNVCRAAPTSVRALSPLLGWKAPQRWWPQFSGAMPDYSLFGLGLPNKHTGTLQPQLWASPWLTSSPVSPQWKKRKGEKTSEDEKRQLTQAKACRG